MNDSLNILNERLARGEITTEEYETLKAKIQDVPPSSPSASKKSGVPGWVVPAVIVLLVLMAIGHLMRDASVTQADLDQAMTGFNEKAEQARNQTRGAPLDRIPAVSPQIAEMWGSRLDLGYLYTGNMATIDRAGISRLYDQLERHWCADGRIKKIARSEKHDVTVTLGRMDILGSYRGADSDWNSRTLNCAA